MKNLFKLTLKEEYREECIGYIREHTIHCKSETGNLVSEAFQSKENPCVIYLLSEFDTAEHEAMHVSSDADKAFIAKMQGKEAAPPVCFEWTQFA